MRIGIDIRPLQGETQYRGIGKSLGNLLAAIAEDFSTAHDYVFYADPSLPLPAITKHFKNSKVIFVRPFPLGRRRYFRSVLPTFLSARPSKKDIDVFFQYDASLGVPASVPTVTIFHDLIPLLFRGKEPKQHVKGLRKYKNSLAGSMYWRKYLRTLAQYRRSRKIIAISDASKTDYTKYIGGIDPLDIAVIPHGVNGFNKHTKSVSPEVQAITAKPYLLYVGGIDLRKNVKGLLQAFYDVKKDHPELRLVAVGKEFKLQDQLADMGWFDVLHTNTSYAKDVINPGYLTDEELVYLYQHAAAFVLASRYEGFGLPVLEAFQAGCPVIAYSNSSIPEVAGDAAILVPDDEPLAPSISKLLATPSLRAKLIKKGTQQAQKFTWKNTAKATLAVLDDAGH